MNREAAALGVPVYSIFRGRIGAVDNYLSTVGRLVLIERAEDVPRMIMVKKHNREHRKVSSDSSSLKSLVDQLVEIMESEA